jgi:type III secretion protein W
MMRIDGGSLPQDLGSNLGTQQQAPAQTGAWKGESLQVMDTSRSALEDAKEEISMAHSEKAEEKGIKERKAETEGNIDLEKVEQIVQYLEAMHNEDAQAKLEETAQRILEGKRDGPGPREQARQSFSDVTDQFAALSFVAQRGREQGITGERMDAIHDALAELQDDFGPQIRAGLASAAGARDFATDSASAGQFRDTYRDVVLGHAELGKTFDALIEKHGLADFPRVVPALIKSLGEDLSAVRPSRDPEHMQAILSDLYNLEVAVTVLDQAKELASDMQRQVATRV